MLSDKIKEDYFKGQLRELGFKKKFEENNFIIKKSTKNQDIKEHWDFEISKDDLVLKVDVKGLKEQARLNDQHFIEIKNVRGDTGWAWSEYVDGFVFEVTDKWILVEKNKLQELVKQKVDKIFVNESYECLYKLYRREGRKDIMTMIKTSDLLDIAKLTINK